MIFLIHYDRAHGVLVTIREFPDEERGIAAEAKLDLEISLLGCDGAFEVVLLEAESKDALKKTHGRYFNTLEQLKSAERKASQG
jgi:hypothetical protein